VTCGKVGAEMAKRKNVHRGPVGRPKKKRRIESRVNRHVEGDRAKNVAERE